jgi:hypothetical protein
MELDLRILVSPCGGQTYEVKSRVNSSRPSWA